MFVLLIITIALFFRGRLLPDVLAIAPMLALYLMGILDMPQVG